MPNSVQAISTPHNLFSCFHHTTPYFYRLMSDGFITIHMFLNRIRIWILKTLQMKRIKAMAKQGLVNHQSKKIFNPNRDVSLVEQLEEETVYLVVFHLQISGGRKSVEMDLHLQRIRGIHPQTAAQSGCINETPLVIKCFTGKIILFSSSFFSLYSASSLGESMETWVTESKRISCEKAHVCRTGMEWIRLTISSLGTYIVLGTEPVPVSLNVSDKVWDKGLMGRHLDTFEQKKMDQKSGDHGAFYFHIKTIIATNGHLKVKAAIIKRICSQSTVSTPNKPIHGRPQPGCDFSITKKRFVESFCGEMRDVGRTQLSHAK